MFDPAGNPYGQNSKIEFSDHWVSTEVDDNFEKYSARHRWFWSPDGQVIIHDFNFDSVAKETGEKKFRTIVGRIPGRCEQTNPRPGADGAFDLSSLTTE